jgi:hypothetical protein
MRIVIRHERVVPERAHGYELAAFLDADHVESSEIQPSQARPAPPSTKTVSKPYSCSPKEGDEMVEKEIRSFTLC